MGGARVARCFHTLTLLKIIFNDLSNQPFVNHALMEVI